MQYKHFYISILIRILLIIIVSGSAVYLFFVEELPIVSFLSVSVLVFLIINTLKYFNNINRWIAFFLLGIENNDTSLRIPKNSGNKAIDDIFSGIHRLNEIFKQTKVEINVQEQYFKSIINESATGLMAINQVGRIEQINPAAERLLNASLHQHIRVLDRINEHLPNFILSTKEVSEYSSTFENQLGQKLMFKVSLLVRKDETVKLIAINDITKELEAKEVDAWIKLARTLSHEIMNTIAPITTISQYIASSLKADDKIMQVTALDQTMIDQTAKGMEMIEERSKGLMHFVENYRRFTSLPEPRFEQVNLHNLLESVLLIASAYDGFSKTKITLELSDEFTISIDKNLISQVLINIIKNAFESISLSQTQNAQLHISLHQNGTKTTLEIKNNGESIPNEIREQIFIPFFTTKERGSGIGLSLSKQMMLKMGGDLQLTCRNSNFTCFQLILN